METTKELEVYIDQLKGQEDQNSSVLNQLIFAKMVRSTINNEPGLADDEIKTLLKAVDLIRLFY